ncbi:unnamed protein product, partial [Rotaria sp. Silwood1]
MDVFDKLKAQITDENLMEFTAILPIFSLQDLICTYLA